MSTLRGSYGRCIRCKRPGLDQGAPSGPRLLNCKFSHTNSLVRCSRALRLRRLAQNGCPVLLLSEGRFTSMPCSFFFELCQSRVACGTSGTFWSLKRCVAWQVQDIRHFFIRVAETVVVSIFDFWTWWWFRVAGEALRTPQAHSSRQAQYFVDLDSEVAVVFSGSLSLWRSANAQPSRDFVHQIAIDFFFQPIATKKYQDYYSGILTRHWDLRITPYVRMELETSLTPQASPL